MKNLCVFLLYPCLWSIKVFSKLSFFFGQWKHKITIRDAACKICILQICLLCVESLLFVGIYFLARIWSDGECRSEVWQEWGASHKCKICRKKFWVGEKLRRRAWTRQHSLCYEFIQCSWRVLNWWFLCDRVSMTQMAVSQDCTIQLGESADFGPDIFYSWQESCKNFSSRMHYLTDFTIFISVENCFATRPVFFRCIQYS